MSKLLPEFYANSSIIVEKMAKNQDFSQTSLDLPIDFPNIHPRICSSSGIFETMKPSPSAVLVLADGTILVGDGVGASAKAVGEICFQTAMTGYQEILTDPSYAGQIITFTFPHIGNVGANGEDVESADATAPTTAKALVLRASITDPSNYRSVSGLNEWLCARGIPGIAGVDTRALTRHIRTKGMTNAAILHDPGGINSDTINVLLQEARGCPDMENQELAHQATTKDSYEWREFPWRQEDVANNNEAFRVVAIDFGLKWNILRCLKAQNCHVDVVPATTSAKEILDLKPDGVFLSNGPGDPHATFERIGAELKQLIESGVPLFGICLGHQLLALAFGATTQKMQQGHHGANHPVKHLESGTVEITSMNHGFCVGRDNFPDILDETHISLFDNSNCGFRARGKPVFAVQYHPEASPGPHDSAYLFARFHALMQDSKKGNKARA